jgi:hypothetical protein
LKAWLNLHKKTFYKQIVTTMKSFLKNIALTIAGSTMVGLFANAQQSMNDLIAGNMKLAATQYELLASKTPQDSMPRHYDPSKNKWVNSDTKWWCSGFFPGSLWLIYDYTKDGKIRTEAERRLSILEKEKHYTGNHDLGFMMYCSFGTAFSITGNKVYKPTIDTAALSLITRYRPFNTIHSILG